MNSSLDVLTESGTGNSSDDRVRFWSYREFPPKFLRVLVPLPGKRYIPNEKIPDIIELSHLLTLEKVAKRVLSVRLRYGWKPVVYLIAEEPWKAPSAGIDFSFTLQPSTEKNCWRYSTGHLQQTQRVFRSSTGKRCWCHDDEFEYLLTNRIDEHGQLRQWHETEKTRFCNFIYSNTKKIRNDFCELLARYKPVACPGEELNNTSGLTPYATLEGIPEKLGFIATCRFTIAFENCSIDHYMTEKIYHAFCANSVPVYWGCPQVAEYYNPAAFINCHDYESFEEVVEKIKEIDNDPELYRRYLNAPSILPTSRFHRMQKEIRHYSEMIVNTALERRKEKNSRLKDMLSVNRVLWTSSLWVFLHYLYWCSPSPFKKVVSGIMRTLHLKQIIVRFFLQKTCRK